MEKCEERIGYRFSDRSLLKKALTHSSCAATRIESNERLEFLGDATLGLVISDFLYRRFPQKNEGDLSELKSEIVSRSSCCRVASKMGLNSYLMTGKGITVIPYSLISNVMESVIGAIFLDGGFEEARLFIEENFQEEIDGAVQTVKFEGVEDNCDGKAASESMHNYKTLLQIKMQKKSPELVPKYVLLEEKGPPHDKRFKIAAKIGDNLFYPAWGKNKKEAERRAAGNALFQMQDREPPFCSQNDEIS